MLRSFIIFTVFAFLASIPMSLTGPARATPTDEASFVGEKLVVFIKTDVVLQAGMGLHLARGAARQGVIVTLIFGADGVTYPMKEGEQEVFGATGETPRQMIREIIKAGAKVYVCKLCTVWLDLEQDDFLPEIEIVNGMQIFSALFEHNARSLEF